MSTIKGQKDNLKGMLKDGLISKEEYDVRIKKLSKQKTANDFIRKDQFDRPHSNKKEKLTDYEVRKTSNNSKGKAFLDDLGERLVKYLNEIGYDIKDEELGKKIIIGILVFLGWLFFIGIMV